MCGCIATGRHIPMKMMTSDQSGEARFDGVTPLRHKMKPKAALNDHPSHWFHETGYLIKNGFEKWFIKLFGIVITTKEKELGQNCIKCIVLGQFVNNNGRWDNLLIILKNGDIFGICPLELNSLRILNSFYDGL